MNYDISLANPPEASSADVAAEIADLLHQAADLAEQAYVLMDNANIDRHNLSYVGQASDLLVVAEHSTRNG
jgi:hypothetical protein